MAKFAESARRRKGPLSANPAVQAQNGSAAGEDVRRQAWEWAVANREEYGSLPSGKLIGDKYGRHERWVDWLRAQVLRASSRAWALGRLIGETNACPGKDCGLASLVFEDRREPLFGH